MQTLDQPDLANGLQDKLFQALAKINRPGSFCASDSLSAVLPGLEIAEVGTIALPLTRYQAKQIKDQCKQAPYGKGEQTLVDTNVRRVWQLDLDRFKLTNPEWQNFLAQTLKTVEQELGLEEQKLESHLYNLLLYDKDSFFLPHRDGEKVERMVATLVVVLPSEFKGGELIIRHEGREQIIDFGSLPNTSFHTHFVAFYADCEHEVKPLREGYRLCLVYNLSLKKLSLQKSNEPIRAPRSQEHVNAVTGVLRDWLLKSGAGSPQKLAIKLDHQYSQDGLAWDALKGVDRVKAQVIREAARNAGCRAYLALLTLYQSGSVEYSGGGYSGGRGRWNDDYGSDNPSNYEMEDIEETSLSAAHWVDDDGNSLGLDEMTIEDEEVVPQGSLTDVDPEEAFRAISLLFLKTGPSSAFKEMLDCWNNSARRNYREVTNGTNRLLS